MLEVMGGFERRKGMGNDVTILSQKINKTTKAIIFFKKRTIVV